MADSFMDRLRAKRAAEEAEAVNGQISEVLWRAQLGEDIPRIVRLDRINVGSAYELTGSLFPDGKTRCCVHPKTKLDEAATIAKMDRMDEDAHRGR